MIEKILQLLIALLSRWQNRDSLKTLGAARSSKWPAVRKKFLTEHPNCALCGGVKMLELHHIKKFSDYPELELEPSNFLPLCENGTNGIVCHRAFGHLGDYKKINPDVIQDTAIWHDKIANRK